MLKFAMPSGDKMRRVCKEAKRKNLTVFAKTSRLNRCFSAKLSSSNVKAMALTRALENIGGSKHLSHSAWLAILTCSFSGVFVYISGFLLFGLMLFLAESLSSL